jgi:hypothetical protein
MKTIKNVIVLAILTLTLTGAFAQSGETKNLLINKWIIDKEAMKPIIGIMLATNPQFSTLDAAGKEGFLNTIVDQQLSGIKLEYRKDGTFTGSNPDGSNTTGNWTLSTNEKELTTKAGDKPEKKYNIVAVSKTKLHLMGEGNREIFLKTENQ